MCNCKEEGTNQSDAQSDKQIGPLWNLWLTDHQDAMIPLRVEILDKRINAPSEKKIEKTSVIITRTLRINQKLGATYTWAKVWKMLLNKNKKWARKELLYFDLAYYDCALRTHNDVQRTKSPTDQTKIIQQGLRTAECSLWMHIRHFTDMTTCKCFVSKKEHKKCIHC